jgi:DHHC palmitoyltransferase
VSSTAEVADDDSHPIVKLCTTCLVDKTFVSIHCSRCNTCIPNLDHHCVFVSNCIARGNRRIFVYFTLSASFGCALYFLLAIYTQHFVLCKSERHMVSIVGILRLLSFPCIAFFLTEKFTYFVLLSNLYYLPSHSCWIYLKQSCVLSGSTAYSLRLLCWGYWPLSGSVELALGNSP